MEATWAERGCRWGQMLCWVGASHVAEEGAGRVAAATLPVAVQLSAALGSSSVLCQVGHAGWRVFQMLVS